MGGAPKTTEFAAERLHKRRRLAQVGPDTAAILAAIETLETELRGLREEVRAGDTGAPAAEDDAAGVAARVEIAQMVRKIGQAKMEIASIKHPDAVGDRMDAATNELDAILIATETSTHDILAASERIEGSIRRMTSLRPEDQELLKLSEDVAGEIIRIFEACNFQDITGQRITKVVKTIKFIEQRILAIIEIWGREAFADLPESNAADADADDDRRLMNGPQLPNQGISQDDINALFD